VFTDFATNDFLFSQPVSNQTHGIGVILNPQSGEPFGPTVFDDSAAFGSAGELEQVLFMNNVMMMWPDAERLVNPPIEPFGPNSNIMVVPELFGLPVSLDGQPTTQNRLVGTLPPDDGEWSRHFRHGGLYGLGLMSHMALMAHETGHRWIAHLRFVHPTKGGDGLDSYDLLGRGIDHWSWFLNTGVPASQFGGAPRSSCMEGNAILDLGVIPEWNGTPTNLDPGERVFRTPADQLIDGWSALDQHLMGLRRAADVGPFFYVDEPRSLYTGQSLDVFDPQNPLNTEVTMRGWQPLSGVVFKGKRVDLTIANIQDHEKQRERRENPQGRRFWGPKGNLTVRYFSDTRRVDPAGNASTVLSTADRELGDEADRIEPDGRPVDVKTMAFVLLVQQGPPQSHGSAIGQVETLRGAWQEYANGPASGGRGRFDTSLDPTVY
jgi:hypothetical protein